jgi:hypothetical protein
MSSTSWPSISASNPSVGNNNQTAPTSSTEVGGINPTGNLQPLQTDASGNLLVSLAAEPLTPFATKDAADGTPGAAAPGTAIQVAGSDGTDLRTVLVDSTGRPLVVVNAPLPAGTNIIGKVGIDQTTPGTTNGVQVNAALPAGSNTIGNVGVVAGAAIIGKVGIDQTTPGTTNGVQVNAPLPAGTNVIGHVIVDSTAGPTDLTASGSITTQNLNPNSGTATAGSTVGVTGMNGQTTATIQVTGTYTGALTAQGTVDGSNWIALAFIQNVNTATNAATIASATVGIFQADVGGFTAFRISANAAITGTAVVTVRVSTGNALIALDAPLPAGTNAIGNITTVSTVTAVTAISNALPAGTNLLGKTGIDQTTNGTTNAVNVIPNSSSTSANSSAASTALEASHVIKAGSGRLYQLVGVNNSTSAQYIQVFNSTTVPADTTVPILVAYVPGNSNFSWDFGAIGRYFSTGITVTNSSTAATKTIGSANCWFNAEYL